MNRGEEKERHHHFYGPFVGLCAEVPRAGVQLHIPGVSLSSGKERKGAVRPATEERGLSR